MCHPMGRCVFESFSKAFSHPGHQILMFAETLLPRLWAFFPLVLIRDWSGYGAYMQNSGYSYPCTHDEYKHPGFLSTASCLCGRLSCLFIYLFILQRKPFFKPEKNETAAAYRGLIAIKCQHRDANKAYLPDFEQRETRATSDNKHVLTPVAAIRLPPRENKRTMVEDSRDSWDTIIIMKFNHSDIKVIYTVYYSLYIIAVSVRG